LALKKSKSLLAEACSGAAPARPRCRRRRFRAVSAEAGRRLPEKEKHWETSLRKRLGTRKNTRKSDV